ncbi:4Fe-4S dicluster domain-containing protein [Haliangium sp.]|uniref:4Fe-4S dicluster domain-containing protein n=1 Tax=Haliangium sp. TaxID=2663208 RepID=UPI003D0F3EB3
MSRRALLRKLMPGAAEPAPRFVVRVDRARCITFMGPECGACIGQCTDDAQALRLSRHRPEFAAESCVGCGRCISACPTMPAALSLEPVAHARRPGGATDRS